MKDRPFRIVDVFAEDRLAGNQLAVITESEGLETDDMQRIAREMNFSETAFLLSKTEHDGAYPVRIFTPGQELPFAGHPTLGSSYVIRDEVLNGKGDALTLNPPAGRIPVRFEDGSNGAPMVWMRQLAPTFGKTLNREASAAVLGLRTSQVDERFTPQIVSTGLEFLIVPLVDLEAVQAATLDRKLARSASLRSIYLFAPEAVEKGNDIHARMFSVLLEREDPATGSACGCLASYLVEHEYFGDGPIAKRVEQGYAVDRPSLLQLEARRGEKDIEVHVGGRVQNIAKGVFTS